MGNFFSDTEPVADGSRPGRYRSKLGDDWNAVFAFGGATMGAAVRAMNAHVAEPELRPVSVHALFLDPVKTGGVVVDVETLRGGRSVRQVAAALRPEGADAPALRLQGTWGRDAADHVVGIGLEPPRVPGPDGEGVEPLVHDERFAHLPLHVHFEERECPGWTVPGSFFADPASARSAVWTRLSDGHRDENGRFDPAILPVLADRGPGPHLGPTMRTTSPDGVDGRPMVTLELAIRFVSEPASDWLLLAGSIVEAGNRYLTTRTALWDEDRTLIAIADQTARFASRSITEVAPRDGGR